MPFWNHSVFFDRLLKIKIHNIVTSLLISWPRILIFWALARTCFRKDKWAANMDCHFAKLAKPSKPSWSHFFLLLSVMNMMLLKLLNTSLSKTQMIRERASWKTTREKKDSLSVLLGPAFYFTIFAFITLYYELFQLLNFKQKMLRICEQISSKKTQQI